MGNWEPRDGDSAVGNVSRGRAGLVKGGRPAGGPRSAHELRVCGEHGDHGGRRLFKRGCQLTCPVAGFVCSFLRTGGGHREADGDGASFILLNATSP